MKRKAVYLIMIASTILLTLSCIVYTGYKDELSNVLMVTEIHGDGSNFRHTYLRVIIPQGSYHGYRTLLAIYWRMTFKHGRQNWVEIIVYDTWECLESNTEYMHYRFNTNRDDQHGIHLP